MAKSYNVKIFSLVKWTAEHAFLVFIILFLISLIVGGIMFYKYGILARSTELEPEAVLVRFSKDSYQKIEKEQQSRRERFEQADFKEHQDPFWIDVD